MKSKNWRLPLALAVVLILILLVKNFFSVDPVQIEELKNAKVEVKYEKGKVHYKMTKNTPANWTPYEEISKEAREAIVISEDALFWQHEGFDMKQIKEAVDDHVTKGKNLRGASTISQQLVKNLFLTNKKTFSRKAKEAVITKELEKKLSKKKILETYLNVIEYGKGVYGIKQASKHYFDKEPSELNAKEGAFLAMLLPNPKKNAESFRNKKMTPYAEKTVASILDKMNAVKKISDEELSSLKEMPLEFNSEAPVLDTSSIAPGNSTGEENAETKAEGSAKKKVESEEEVAEKKSKKAERVRKAKEKRERLAAIKRKKRRNKYDQNKLKNLRNMIKGMEQEKAKIKNHDGKPIVKKTEDLKAPGDLATNEKLIQDEVIGVEEEMSLE